MNKTLTLRPSNEQHVEWLHAVLDNLFDAVVVADSEGKIEDFNRAAEVLFGYQKHEVLGENVTILMPRSIANQHHQFMQNPQQGDGPRVLGRLRELEGIRKNGELFPITIALSCTTWCEKLRYIASIRDLSETREAEQTIQTLSMYDANTGLPNRQNFLKLMQHQLQYSNIRVIAVNMDFFNRVNVAVGSAEGNEMLKILASRMAALLADFDGVLAKDIEDRFWIGIAVKPNDTRDFQPNRMKKLLALLREEVMVNGRPYRFTASIGVAQGNRGANASEVIAHAETAVHQAKTNGRDQFSVYQNIMTEQIVAEFELEQQLRYALQHNQLECWLQTKVDQDQKWASAEALVRWRSDGKVIGPNQFIPIAERLGLINEVGLLMMRNVAQIIQQVIVHAPQFQIAMNVSPRQFMHEEFCANLQQIFSDEGAPLANLTIEITENLLVQDINRVQLIMKTLVASGVQFSIDDFGTGYSNLKRLQWIPVTEVKIDRQFVVAGMQSKRGKALLDTITVMGQNLGMNTVAEGIETKAQFEYILAQGVQQFQGFYFHKPEPAQQWLQTFTKKLYQPAHLG